MTSTSTTYLQSVVRELSKLPDETEWVEFKIDNDNPQEIGEYISAISNSATLLERPKGYIVWGVSNNDHKIVGTKFQYRSARKGSEELEAWLARLCEPRINFRFHEVKIDDDIFVTLLEVPCAERQPTKFAGREWVRIGSNKKPLSVYPDKEAELWRLFDRTPTELRAAAQNLTEDDAVQLLDYAKYYDLMGQPIPRSREQVLTDLVEERFIERNDAGNWDITNVGALMIAKDLRKIETLVYRTVRVIWYKDRDRMETIREREFSEGYAISHEDVVQYIMTIIPQQEVIQGAIRRSEVSFPEVAIRELLANMTIHQTLDQRGTHPMVEVFSDRIEFSNAGAPLVAIERIVDSVPRSRNEVIAGFMHKCGICEERGSGYDKILASTAKQLLLAPLVINQNNQFTKAVLFAKVPFDMITKADKIRTCYMNACLSYVNFEMTDNKSVRLLFGLTDEEKYKATRIIKDTVETGLIKPLDPAASPRYMKYVPSWA